MKLHPLLVSQIAFTFALILFLSLHSCKSTDQIRSLRGSEVILLSEGSNNYKTCNEKSNYAPSNDPEHSTPVRTVRVNFHYINSNDGKANYSVKTGTHFARDLIAQANSDLSKNAKMNLPIGNNTPALPTKYKYKLTPDGNRPGDLGVYFHKDEDHCYFIHKGKNRNSTNKTIIKKYAVNPDSVLNVFVMPHHPDSVKSRSYGASQTGIALGTSVKISGILEKKGYQPWLFRGLLNHEIGHTLGLPHAWGKNDGCDDTPANPNCWHRTKNGSKCDSLNSNNVMDYNMNQNSWTPCQLSRIHYNFAKLGSRQRKLLIPNWCKLDTNQTIRIRQETVWQSAKDLSGHLIIKEGGTLTIKCRVALPKGAKIIVEPGAHLILDDAWLHNDCDELWEGIKVVERGKKGMVGKVSFIGKPKIQNTVEPWKMEKGKMEN